LAVYFIHIKCYSLSFQSLALSKQLCRSAEKDKLHDVNNKECDLLAERWLSEECAQAVMAFMARKAKM
jgi:peroxisomal 3,2-trans-enoyl-CoA isomerase